jgi:hypothetical protein
MSSSAKADDPVFRAASVQLRRHGVLDALGSQNKCNTCYGVVAMGQCYCQLSLEERIEIYRLHAAGEPMQMIARSLKRHVSTISREIDRNGLATKVWPGGYAPARAQKLAERRRRWDGRSLAVRPAPVKDPPVTTLPSESWRLTLE